MQQLLDEVSFASHQLVQVQQLATECEKLRDTPKRSDTGQDTKDLSLGAQGDGRHTADDELSPPTSVEGVMATGEGTHRRGQRALLCMCVLCVAAIACELLGILIHTQFDFQIHPLQVRIVVV